MLKYSTSTKRKTRKTVQKLVNKHRPDMIKPEVLCIGPEKTATTWLYWNFRQHPQVWVPPTKELHFLSQGTLIPAHSIKSVLFSSHWFYRGLRTQAAMQLKENLKRCFSIQRSDSFTDEVMRVKWMLNYALGERSYDWYAGLFPVTPQLCVDTTPSYYGISDTRIQEHKDFNPATKIIIIIRNPVDRLWSGARMVLCQRQGHSIDQVSYAEYIRYFDQNFQDWRPYLQTIEMWERHFDDVHVAYYDELCENPELFFTKVCIFLGIKHDVELEDVNQKVHVGIRGELPLELRYYLYNLFNKEMIQMADSGIEYAHKWLDEHNEIVKDALSK